MPTYIIERNVGSLTSDQLTAADRMSNSVLADMPEVVWVRVMCPMPKERSTASQ